MAGIIQLLKHRLSRDPTRFRRLEDFFDLALQDWRDDLRAGQTETTRLEQGGSENPALWTRVFFAEMVAERADRLDAMPDQTSPDAQKLLTAIAARWCATIPEQAEIAHLTALARAAEDSPRKRALARAAMRREVILNDGLAWTHRTPEKMALMRLKQDWERQQPLRSFQEEAGVDFVALGSWVATLDRDTLHVFVSMYDFGHENLTPLHAAISNPACDKATALSLFAWCDPAAIPQDPAEWDSTTADIAGILDALHKRLTTGVFCPSSLAPAPEVARLLELNFTFDTPSEDLPSRWALPADAFKDLGTERPDPAYEVSHQGLQFRTPFRPGIYAA